MEKTPGQGEDAAPVVLSGNGRFFLGVFDGMGGAGSTVYDINGTQRTGAYLASRTANNCITSFFLDFINDPDTGFNEHMANELTFQLHQVLQQEFDKLTSGADTKLKSRLLKPLPTTFAGLFIEEATGQVKVFSLWAGDSRNFLLTADGLQQLSADDLKFKFDPMENLKKDSPLDNVISAEGDFLIRCRQLDVIQPCILFSVTDGCYGYFSTPMRFELALVKTLSESHSLEEWNEQLIRVIGEVAGDDYSMALICLGFADFEQVISYFKQRLDLLYAFYINDIDVQIKEIADLRLDLQEQEMKLKKAEQRKSDTELQTWGVYKSSYLKYIESLYEKRG
ncbi:hypothetical protein [Mucilaginibacter oryzae]|nr:hypothetical protein [Mucilaginibacter oryzae]